MKQKGQSPLHLIKPERRPGHDTTGNHEASIAFISRQVRISPSLGSGIHRSIDSDDSSGSKRSSPAKRPAQRLQEAPRHGITRCLGHYSFAAGSLLKVHGSLSAFETAGVLEITNDEMPLRGGIASCD